MSKTALILGVSGQDGAYLSNHLLNLGYRVIGSSRDHFTCDTSRLQLLGLIDDLELCSINTNNFQDLLNAVKLYHPSEIYNLSGFSSVGLSFKYPIECIESIVSATLNILEVIRYADFKISFFNSGSSECFGDTGDIVANENTPFRPLSPYAAAKSSAFWLVSTYREAYNLSCCTGILSNHESPLRPSRFVTQKIVSSAQDIVKGKLKSIKLGNLNVHRDWGWAPDYVKAMHLMLQSDHSKDYLIATGLTRCLRDLATDVFSYYGLNFDEYCEVDEALFRTSDIYYSSLDPLKIRRDLGWCAETLFDQMTHKLASSTLF